LLNKSKVKGEKSKTRKEERKGKNLRKSVNNVRLALSLLSISDLYLLLLTFYFDLRGGC